MYIYAQNRAFFLLQYIDMKVNTVVCKFLQELNVQEDSKSRFTRDLWKAGSRSVYL